MSTPFKQVLLDTVGGEVLEAVTTKEFEAYLDVTSKIRDTVRLYYLNKDVIENMIWTPFRENEDALNMLMRLTMSFHFRLAENGLEQAFKNCIAAYLSGPLGTKLFADADFTDKLAGKDDSLDYPGWLNFLIFTVIEYRYLYNAMRAGG